MVSVPKLVGDFKTTRAGGFESQSSLTGAGGFELRSKPTNNGTDTIIFTIYLSKFDRNSSEKYWNVNLAFIIRMVRQLLKNPKVIT